MGELSIEPPLSDAPEAPRIDPFRVEVMAEIDRLQNRRSSWTQALVVLTVSLAIFLFAGTMQWDRGFLLLIIPILFFHELGHYAAMKAVGYTNLRMFFIPLFGAAVSGQHYNVSAWKRVVVALAGPVPGIVVAAVLTVIAIRYQNEKLHQIALLTLILNGFNLLPLLPLDGGHVARAILFSRHPLLDVGFRVVAALILIIGSYLLLSEKLLMVVGVFMLLGVPVAWQTARIVADLRREGISGASADAKSIPEETAFHIIGRLRHAMPKLNATQIAPRVLSVFQDLNARPPGIGLSLGLGAIHGVAFIAALLFSVGLFVAQVMRSPGYLEQLAGDIVYPLDVSAMVPAHDPPIPAGTLIVTTYGSLRDAQKDFKPAQDSASIGRSLFGCSTFMAFSVRFQNDSAIADGPNSGSFIAVRDHDVIWMRIYCSAANAGAADAILQDLQKYETAAGTPAKGPWLPAQSSSDTTLPGEDVYAVEALSTSARGRLLKVEFSARDPQYAAPAMATWLAGQGCHSFSYEIGKRRR